jgi:ketosteroid isomerase-like protein
MINVTLAAIAAAAIAAPTDAPPADATTSVEETYARANSALLKGDAETWNELAPLTNDFVLFSPFGGTPSRYADYSPERIERMGRFFKNGSFAQEIVQAYATDDMIVLATIERANVEVGGLPAQDWALRVTSVFKREGAQWKLAHRHADPFVEDVALQEAARLARGERTLAAK